MILRVEESDAQGIADRLNLMAETCGIHPEVVMEGKQWTEACIQDMIKQVKQMSRCDRITATKIVACVLHAHAELLLAACEE